MSRVRLLHILALLVCAIAVLHIAATIFYLYWEFWWYDMLLHFLGGMFIGLLVLWLRFFSGYISTPAFLSARHAFLFTLFWLVVIGIGWEAFERALGHTWSLEGYWLDTSIDVALDIIGGVVGFLFFKDKYMNAHGV